MNLDVVRSVTKKSLSRLPFAYDVGKKCYVSIKSKMDEIIFKSRYPKAKYIRFDANKIRSIKGDGYYSQYGQDYYLWNEIFSRQKQGFYVDIGGNDPVVNSNTYFLERQGWKGIAFDPLSRFEKMWGELRNAQFHRVAISDKTEMRDFIEIVPKIGWEHALSGFKEFVREEDVAIYQHLDYKVETKPLSEFLDDSQKVDILLVDVEGAEEMVFRGIDLARIAPRYIMVENVREIGGQEGIRSTIKNQGYELIARIGIADDLFKRL